LNEPVKSYKYFKGNLKTIGQDELTTKFKQAHNALWGGGELDPAAAFDEFRINHAPALQGRQCFFDLLL
jgi:type I restriction enzyme M protein